jgi:hypothetical protein
LYSPISEIWDKKLKPYYGKIILDGYLYSIVIYVVQGHERKAPVKIYFNDKGDYFDSSLLLKREITM